MGAFELYFAYLDPGTGSMILQVVIAGALTASVAFRGFFYSVFSFVGKRIPSKPTKLDSVIPESKKL